MALLILLKPSHINKQSLLWLQSLNQILHRNETQLNLTAIVKPLQLPPPLSKELIVSIGLIVLHMGLPVDQEVTLYETLRTGLHHFESPFNDLGNGHLPRDVVDYLEGRVQIHL